MTVRTYPPHTLRHLSQMFTVSVPRLLDERDSSESNISMQAGEVRTVLLRPGCREAWSICSAQPHFFYCNYPIFTFFIVSLSNVKPTALILLLLPLTSTLLGVVRSGRQQSSTTSASPKFPAKARQRRKKEDSPKSGAS